MESGKSSPSNEIDSLARQLQNIKFALDQAAIVAVTDAAGRIVYANDKFCEITKYAREELIGQNHRIINSGHHPREFFVEMWKTISSGQIWVGEILNRAKDNQLYWVHTTIVPLMDAQGRPEEYISIRFEISQRKEAEKQLGSYAAKLAKSNRELQDFASIAAHDLQEPLRKIQAFSDRVRSRLLGLLGAAGSEKAEAREVRDYLDRMQGAAGRMQTLINDLLTYSRVATKTQPFASLDLNKIISEVVSDLVVLVEQTHGVVEVDSLPEIDADPVQMRQLFQNLIGNALKFHKKDEPPRVRVSARLSGDFCEVHVKDNGIGFDEKYLDRIFTIFQRLHGRHEYDGTGVGLAVCRRIVERHEGTITAESAPGQGATFIVTLPLRTAKGEQGL
jgi:PAS domain S-box-containing protein